LGIFQKFFKIFFDVQNDLRHAVIHRLKHGVDTLSNALSALVSLHDTVEMSR
jgi:hypothetical protein